jgi:SnoaL-like domain
LIPGDPVASAAGCGCAWLRDLRAVRPVIRLAGMTAGEVFAAFADAWNAGDAAVRVRLLDVSCAPGAAFISPGSPVRGTAALSDAIGEFRRAFPASMVSFGIPDEHNGFVRVAWVTQFGTVQPSLAGDDFAQLAADGRIVLLVSFDGTAEGPVYS